jgi:hypothetical protein
MRRVPWWPRRPCPIPQPNRSFITASDHCVAARLREMIADRFPQHGVLG